MAGGPRDYGAGVERMLYRIAHDNCYFPECQHPILLEADGTWISNVEIAHIRGAKPGSARFDPTMSDRERAAITNLILLCPAHHKLVDRIRAEEYPADLLSEWKASNEADGQGILAGSGLTAADLEAALEEIAGRLSPQREVSVELACGLLRPSNQLSTVDSLPQLETLLEKNPALATLPHVLAVSIRNSGAVAVEVEAIELRLVLSHNGDQEPYETAVQGFNDFPDLNGHLPRRIKDGAAAHWLINLLTLRPFLEPFDSVGVTIDAARAEVRLATGETTKSNHLPFVSEQLT